MEDLLIPRHSLNQYHQSQLELLRSLPEEQRVEHAQLLRLGNAAYLYQQQAEGGVRVDDFWHWLEGLPEKMRQAMEREGFDKNKELLAMRRHSLERRGIGYDEFVRRLLSAEDWEYEQSLLRGEEASEAWAAEQEN